VQKESNNFARGCDAYELSSSLLRVGKHSFEIGDDYELIKNDEEDMRENRNGAV
jgi:hypothetical protein